MVCSRRLRHPPADNQISAALPRHLDLLQAHRMAFCCSPVSVLFLQFKGRFGSSPLPFPLISTKLLCGSGSVCVHCDQRISFLISCFALENFAFDFQLPTYQATQFPNSLNVPSCLYHDENTT